MDISVRFRRCYRLLFSSRCHFIWWLCKGCAPWITVSAFPIFTHIGLRVRIRGSAHNHMCSIAFVVVVVNCDEITTEIVLWGRNNIASRIWCALYCHVNWFNYVLLVDIDGSGRRHMVGKAMYASVNRMEHDIEWNCLGTM